MVYSAELLTDFSYTNFTVSIGQTPCSLDLNVILFQK